MQLSYEKFLEVLKKEIGYSENWKQEGRYIIRFEDHKDFTVDKFANRLAVTYRLKEHEIKFVADTVLLIHRKNYGMYQIDELLIELLKAKKLI